LRTTPVVILDSLDAVPAYPVGGDFWGTGHKAVGFPKGRWVDNWIYYELHIFSTDSNKLDTIPTVILSMLKMKPPLQETIARAITAADLDGDGDDELVMMFGGRYSNGDLSRKPEVWIFRGGPDFQVDTPTVVLQDSQENGGNSGQFMAIGHWDNDSKLDLITGSDYSDGINKLKFFFGSESSPWNWSQPDRVVPMSAFIPMDCDGDGMLDIVTGGEDYKVSMYLSGSGKNLRTRSLSSGDIDLTLRASTYYCVPNRVGYLSDSSRRFDVLTINVGGVNYLFSGGPNGPDPYYDGYTGDMLGGIQPIGDVNGDGWDEVMSGTYTVNFESGYAAIFAGGPYIPRDPSLGVKHITSENRSGAIAVWPNPATTELHIAWRGDLHRMPRRFAIHNLLGQLVAQGEVESWRGEALWQCDDAPAGVYILSIQEHQGAMIATTRVIKQ
jgi:hypothetical protein